MRRALMGCLRGVRGGPGGTWYTSVDVWVCLCMSGYVCVGALDALAGGIWIALVRAGAVPDRSCKGRSGRGAVGERSGRVLRCVRVMCGGGCWIALARAGAVRGMDFAVWIGGLLGVLGEAWGASCPVALTLALALGPALAALRLGLGLALALGWLWLAMAGPGWLRLARAGCGWLWLPKSGYGWL